MKYKLLGTSGLRVSELALGTMTFGDDWGWGASRDESRKIFDVFVDAGGNFIDTASNYTNGTAEKFVGEFVASQRDYFVVATKYTLRRPGSDSKDLNAGGNHRKNMMRTVQESLKRLNTDHIDLLYLHIWDFTTPVEQVMRNLDDLVQSGKVLHIGISDTPAWIVSRAQTIAELRGWHRFVAYQGEWSLNERGIEHDVLPMTRSLDMALLAFGLLSGGTLTGKFKPSMNSGESTRVKNASDQQNKIADAVVQIAKEIGRTPSQVAINWVRQQSPNVIPILGARRESQIKDNLGVLEFSLSGEQRKRLADTNPLLAHYPHTFWNDFVRRDLIFGKNIDSFES